MAFNNYDICSRELRNKKIWDTLKGIMDASWFQKSYESEAIQEAIDSMKDDEKRAGVVKDLTRFVGKEDAVTKLRDFWSEKFGELKYRSAGKIHTVLKGVFESKGEDTRGVLKMGAPTSVTEKMDGTQIQVHMYRDGKFKLLSHNGNDLIPGKKLLELSDLDPYIPEGRSKEVERTFQTGSLTKNFKPVIPNLHRIVNDMNLKEACFYFELTFAVGQRTPKKIEYDDSLMNRCYLFCMTFNAHDKTYGIPSEVTKLTVNPHTKGFFDSYGIPQVSILFSTEALTIEEFDLIMRLVHENKQREGVVVAQEDCYVKIVTHYFTEKVNRYELTGKYAEIQDVYMKYIDLREKPSSKKKDDTINFKFVNEEFEKELSHDSWKGEFAEFYSIPSAERGKVFDFMYKMEFTKSVLESLGDSFSKLSKKKRNRVLDHIKNKMIHDKDSIRKQLDI